MGQTWVSSVKSHRASCVTRRKSRNHLFLLVSVGAFSGFAAAGCGKSNEPTMPGPKPPEVQVKTVTVTVERERAAQTAVAGSVSYGPFADQQNRCTTGTKLARNVEELCWWLQSDGYNNFCAEQERQRESLSRCQGVAAKTPIAEGVQIDFSQPVPALEGYSAHSTVLHPGLFRAGQRIRLGMGYDSTRRTLTGTDQCVPHRSSQVSEAGVDKVNYGIRILPDFGSERNPRPHRYWLVLYAEYIKKKVGLSLTPHRGSGCGRSDSFVEGLLYGARIEYQLYVAQRQYSPRGQDAGKTLTEFRTANPDALIERFGALTGNMEEANGSGASFDGVYRRFQRMQYDPNLNFFIAGQNSRMVQFPRQVITVEEGKASNVRDTFFAFIHAARNLPENRFTQIGASTWELPEVPRRQSSRDRPRRTSQ